MHTNCERSSNDFLYLSRYLRVIAMVEEYRGFTWRLDVHVGVLANHSLCSLGSELRLALVRWRCAGTGCGSGSGWNPMTGHFTCKVTDTFWG